MIVPGYGAYTGVKGIADQVNKYRQSRRPSAPVSSTSAPSPTPTMTANPLPSPTPTAISNMLKAVYGNYQVPRDYFINEDTRRLTPDVIDLVQKYQPPTKDWVDSKVSALSSLTKKDPELLKSIFWQESHLGADPKQKSGPAIGPFQVEWNTHRSIPESITGKPMSDEDVRSWFYNPDNNFTAAENIIKQKLKSNSDPLSPWQAYNTGAYKKYYRDNQFYPE